MNRLTELSLIEEHVRTFGVTKCPFAFSSSCIQGEKPSRRETGLEHKIVMKFTWGKNRRQMSK